MFKIDIDLLGYSNLYFDDKFDDILYVDDGNKTYSYKVFNPFYLNSDSYNTFNNYIIETLKLYDMYHIIKFIHIIKDNIKSDILSFEYKGLNIRLSERITNLKTKYDLIL